MQVSIVAFKKGQLRVLSHAWDRQLGGRALDDVLFDHFAAEFQAKHGLDVRTNPRAAFRLRMGAEKVRIPPPWAPHRALCGARWLVTGRWHCCCIAGRGLKRAYKTPSF